MALPLAPIALNAVRIGALAATAYYLTRKRRGLPTVTEDTAHDDVGEGVSWAQHKSDQGLQANGDARIIRTIRLGSKGPGVEIDVTALGRIKLKRV
jgi:hypothetical protein